jgi:hypothetical protein
MYQGQIMAVVPAGTVSREQLGLLMAGVPASEIVDLALAE